MKTTLTLEERLELIEQQQQHTRTALRYVIAAYRETSALGPHVDPDFLLQHIGHGVSFGEAVERLERTKAGPIAAAISAAVLALSGQLDGGEEAVRQRFANEAAQQRRAREAEVARGMEESRRRRLELRRELPPPHDVAVAREQGEEFVRIARAFQMGPGQLHRDFTLGIDREVRCVECGARAVPKFGSPRAFPHEPRCVVLEVA
jgi:hypothetical protein